MMNTTQYLISHKLYNTITDFIFFVGLIKRKFEKFLIWLYDIDNVFVLLLYSESSKEDTE